MSDKTGTFVWHELITPDLEAAQGFYGETLGWSSNTMKGDGFEYTMLLQGETPVCGLEQSEAPGQGPHWISYVEVDDIDAVAAKVESLGGKQLSPVIDLPMGRFTLLADPQGSTFRLWQSADEGGASTAFHWTELWAKDPNAVLPFYEKLLGLTSEKFPMPQGEYYILSAGPDKPTGGVMSAPSGVPSQWVSYITVDDTDAAVERAKRHGGKVVTEAMDMEGIGRFAILCDAAGALFGVIKPAPREG